MIIGLAIASGRLLAAGATLVAFACPALADPAIAPTTAPGGTEPDVEISEEITSGLHAPLSRFHVDVGFGSGRFDLGGSDASNSSAFEVGAAFTLSRTLQATLSTRGLDFGRATDDAYRSMANLELGLRWSPFGRYRARGTAFVLDHVQLEAGVGLARDSLGAWDGLNPFDQDDRRAGLGFSAGVRWLPIVTESFAAGLGAWYLGQVIDGDRRDAAMLGFAIELGH
jgi:hypothetical protein